MATKPTPPSQRRGTTTIPAKPPRLPDYVPLPPPTGLGQPDNSLPDASVEAGTLEPLHTIADEQRQRSEEMQRMGVTAYMAQFDSRDPEAQQQTVPGVQHRKVEEYEARTGRR
jgi:hypothetical protein